jgi:hypothetical protein
MSANPYLASNRLPVHAGPRSFRKPRRTPMPKTHL